MTASARDRCDARNLLVSPARGTQATLTRPVVAHACSPPALSAKVHGLASCRQERDAPCNHGQRRRPDAGWLAQVPGGTPHESRYRIADEGVAAANAPA